jgi:hypothetical protein
MQKGQKIRPPTELSPEYIESFLQERAIATKSSPAKLTKDKDLLYLSNLFETLVVGYEEMKLVKKFKDAPSCMTRYTPYQMYERATAYIRATIKARQPLTITGLGLFMGFKRKDFFQILTRKELMENPNMQFIFDYAAFVEMYDEYAAHVKQNPAGPIFILKNFGWKDKFEIEASSTQGALTMEEREEAKRRMASFAELPEGS